MKKIPLLAILALLFLLSCKSEKTAETEASSEQEVTTKYTLTPFSGSPAYSQAHLSQMRFNSGAFGFEIAYYELGTQTSDAPSKMCANSGKGQHIHLIVDDNPYAAKYVPDFEYDIEDGAHHILAFLSRSYHESIKTESAHLAQKVEIKENSIVSSSNISDAMIFYSRPKGTYVGEDTKKIMLDFYLTNVQLGTDYYVEANINGEIHRIDQWHPYYIEGLEMGDNNISLILRHQNGEKVDSPLNPVRRIFTLKEDLPIKSQ